MALDIAPTALTGREVRVYWEDDDAWYLGTVSGFSADDNLHSVRLSSPSLRLPGLLFHDSFSICFTQKQANNAIGCEL